MLTVVNHMIVIVVQTKAVHHEIETYILQSQLDDLVSTLIAEVFIKKSNNLVAFVISFLHRHHYDKVNDIIREIKLADIVDRLADAIYITPLLHSF